MKKNNEILLPIFFSVKYGMIVTVPANSTVTFKYSSPRSDIDWSYINLTNKYNSKMIFCLNYKENGFLEVIATNKIPTEHYTRPDGSYSRDGLTWKYKKGKK